MIDYLIRRYIPNAQDIQNEEVRKSYTILSGVLGIFCNIFLFIIKFVIGYFSNSISIISDAVNNLTDLGTDVISLISAKLSTQPPDKSHPFGHGRFEYIGALLISFIIVGAGMELLKASVQKLIDPEPIIFDPLSIIILTLLISIKFWMYSYNNYIGAKINSEIIRASAVDSISDVRGTAGVIAATVIEHYFNIPLDGIVGFIISLMILYSAYTIARDTISLLLGKAPSPELVRSIITMVRKTPFVSGTHDLEIHDYGPGRIFAAIHAEVSDQANIVDCHAALDNLEEEIMKRLHIKMVIHMDPICTDTHKIAKMNEFLQHIVDHHYPGGEVYRMRMTQGIGRTNIICNLRIPSPYMVIDEKAAQAIRSILSDEIQRHDPTCYLVVNTIKHKEPPRE